MSEHSNIGAVARDTGISVRTIRFYEAEGVLPAPARTRSGYRSYTETDVRRLRLIKNARDLGLSLNEARELVERAFSSECSAFAPQLLDLVATRRDGVQKRIVELQALLVQLDELEDHARHAECATEAGDGQLVAECTFCPMIDDDAEREVP